MLLQTKSVSRTAARLGLSQAAVSRSLAQLRLLFNDPLFVRSGSGLELTHRAEELAGPLEEWLAMTSAMGAPASFAPGELTRTFRIASTDFGVLSVLSPAIPRLNSIAPGCRIDVVSFSPDMYRKLAIGELDLIVSGFEPDLSAVHSRHLFSETQCIIMRSDHRLSGGTDAPSVDEYLEWPHIAITIGDPAFDHVQISLGDRADERRVLTCLPYFYAAPDLIGQSDAILTVPMRAGERFAAAYDFSCRPAPQVIPGFDYWALWHERSARDPAIGWLVDQLVQADHQGKAQTHNVT